MPPCQPSKRLDKEAVKDDGAGKKLDYTEEMIKEGNKKHETAEKPKARSIDEDENTADTGTLSKRANVSYTSFLMTHYVSLMNVNLI